MKTIVVTNQKGGVGKTTVAFHLAHGLAQDNHVLAVDIDPQANLSHSLTGDHVPDENSILCVFNKDMPHAVGIADSLDCIGSNIQLSAVESKNDLSNYFAVSSFLKRQLQKQYDYVVIDTPPNLGLFTVSALLSADAVVIPTDTSIDAVNGIAMLLDDIEDICRDHREHLFVAGILLNAFDSRLNFDKETREKLYTTYPDLMCAEIIPRSTQFREAREAEKPIWEYAKPATAPATAIRAAIRELSNRIQQS